MNNISEQVVFTAAGEMSLQERELPELKPDEVRIRTLASLISPGTERAFFLGLPNTTQAYPQFTGYNNIGEIIAIGERCDRIAPLACASPAPRTTPPSSRQSPPKPIPCPTASDAEAAAFFNLVSIALQGVRKARIEIGESVAVLGSGLIGLLAGQLAALNGGLPVTVIDRDASRLEFARAAGLETVLSAEDGSRVLDPPAVVIEATGHPDAVNAALDLAAPFGRVVLLGSTRGVTSEVNFYRDIHRKGLLVIGAHDIARPALESHAAYWTQSADREVALRLLAAGRIRVEPLITHRFSASDAAGAYDLLRNWDVSALGIILDWRT